MSVSTVELGDGLTVSRIGFGGMALSINHVELNTRGRLHGNCLQSYRVSSGYIEETAGARIYKRGDCRINEGSKTNSVEYIAQARAISWLNGKVSLGVQVTGVDPDIQWETEIKNNGFLGIGKKKLRSDIIYYKRDMSAPPVHVIEAKLKSNPEIVDAYRKLVQEYIPLLADKYKMRNVVPGTILNTISGQPYYDKFSYLDQDQKCRPGVPVVRIFRPYGPPLPPRLHGGRSDMPSDHARIAGGQRQRRRQGLRDRVTVATSTAQAARPPVPRRKKFTTRRLWSGILTRNLPHLTDCSIRQPEQAMEAQVATASPP
jgi:hypothetical protein